MFMKINLSNVALPEITNNSAIRYEGIKTSHLVISSVSCLFISNIWEQFLINQNSIQEEIKSRLKSGNACYISVQNLLSSSLQSRNLKVQIYRTLILPVVLYGYETWSLTLREEHRPRVFENRVLRRIFKPKRDG